MSEHLTHPNHDAIRAELADLQIQAAKLEAQLNLYRTAIAVAKERYPDNNPLQAVARIINRDTNPPKDAT